MIIIIIIIFFIIIIIIISIIINLNILQLCNQFEYIGCISLDSVIYGLNSSALAKRVLSPTGA